MKNIKIITSIFVFSTLISCRCVQEVSGVVIDYNIQEPIEKVKIVSKENNIVYTDSLGRFKYFSMKKGMYIYIYLP
jgi:hypothetical protein